MQKIIVVFIIVFALAATSNVLLTKAEHVHIVEGIPVSGKYSKSVVAIDDKMVQFMKLHQVPAATVAIMKDGQIVFCHGYGYSDVKKSIPTDPNILMRIASISKPFTAAAIRNLIQEGKLSLDSKVTDIIDIQPFMGKVVDPRWYDITIEHLLAHTGGWDRIATNIDPGFISLDIQREMRLKEPPNARHIISYMMSKPLDFNPGEKYAYSNFGYSILGRVIEKVSGMSYFDYLRQNVLMPSGIYDMELARSLPQDRSQKEIQAYYHLGKVKSVFGSGWVSSPDGGFHIEAMDSYGGLIASAADLVKFSQKYWLRGWPRLPGQTGSCYIYGVLDGTYSWLWWRADGINVAILLNQRIGSVDYFNGMSLADIDSCYSSLKPLIDETINTITQWP